MRSPASLSSATRSLAMSAAVVSMALGAAVIVGWHVGSAAFVQIHPTFAPMQYNTALGFLLCGVGLLMAVLKRRRLAVATGGVLFAMALITLLQYILGRDFGVDQLLMTAYITVETSHPGRMAPNTAVCFLLSAAAIVAASLHTRWAMTVVAVLSVLTTALGLAALVGYVSGLDSAYGWGALTRMAVHTAAGFVILGVGYSCLAWRLATLRDGDSAFGWAPDLVALSVCALSLLMWQSLRVSESNIIHNDAREATRLVKRQLSSWLDSRNLALVRMADRWEARTPSRREWEADAANYVAHYNGYQAIEWLDASNGDHWIVTSDDAAADLAPHGLTPADASFVEDASSRPDTVTMRTVNVGAAATIQAFAPVHRDDLVGFIVGVFRSESLLAAILDDDDVAPGYLISVREGSQILYARADLTGMTTVNESSLSIAGVDWHIEVAPSPALAASFRTPLPWVVLIGGLALAGLLNLTIRLEGRSRARSENLRIATERLQLSMAGAQQAAWDWDIPANQVVFSDTWYTMLGYEPGEMPMDFATWERLVHPEDIEGARCAIERYLGGESDLYVAEIRMRCKSGDWKWIKTIGRGFGTGRDGSYVRLAGMHIDIDVAKRLQSELEAKHSEMERFIYTASHDLKSPIVTILGYLSHLVRDTEEGRTDEIGGYADRIRRAAERMRANIDALLQVSRVGRVEEHPELIQLRDAVAQVVECHRSELEDGAVRLEIDVADHVVRMGPGQLDQVLDNLVSNAIRYGATHDQPSIRIWAAPTSDSMIEIGVDDNGEGVSPEHAERIFGLFERLSRDREGTGVGLAIVARVATQLGGRAWVEPGAGGRFRVTLPSGRIEAMAA